MKSNILLHPWVWCCAQEKGGPQPCLIRVCEAQADPYVPYFPFEKLANTANKGAREAVRGTAYKGHSRMCVMTSRPCLPLSTQRCTARLGGEEASDRWGLPGLPAIFGRAHPSTPAYPHSLQVEASGSAWGWGDRWDLLIYPTVYRPFKGQASHSSASWSIT